ncbi:MULTISPECIES: ABC transporter substrate-binding protein [Rhizobium/Agrobacterium group]|uniref:ABC transporter substrate-binding protein n=1 Tax=Rhizobium/Agrobacterium group TaxID=227290 RepID=UPI000558BCAB|nr:MULTISPECIES: ABC transporter substrate-binding protein [Rhizobium/Agrobacterium group]MEA1843954.1 ABC transporter substrate-binding protein [Agrobacterium tumefaciens]NSY71977.1 ABC transporter substrate-binding protein [Agrobacterium tumefaciens]NSZ71363.1 ABC transporter substrate-binding protein [Agrobacterium tumefaciens]NSZ76694.1 ABC transporter substrate-binding protein [Agrobacterium tumefaciens]NSZ86926.1 ABC transporter substrate-binding protein [Agrobacterium tumefaciens]
MSRIRSFVLAAMAAAAIAVPANAETLRWGGRADLYSLDPYSVPSTSNLAFLNHIYEGLVRYGPDFKIEPALATEWKLVDEKTWRFTLRKGVKFHDGAEFTADDVVASFTRASDATSPLRGNIPVFAGVKKVDDYTVDLNVTAPTSLFLNDITNIFIFNAKWLKDNNSEKPTDFASKVDGYTTMHTNGTGPFKLESRVPDSKTVLVANDSWWDQKKHNLDRIEFVPIASAATRVAALLSGEIDLIDSAPIQDLPRLESSPNITVKKRTELRTLFIGFNRREKLEDGKPNPFNDLRVRQAFEASIDRDLINKKVMRDLARPSGSLIAPEIAGYAKSLDTYQPADPAKAQKLLADAGMKNLAFTYTCMNDESINEEDICSGVANMLKRGGFQPTIDIAPRSVQSPKRNGGKADVFNLSWANEPTLDAFSFLSQILSTRKGAMGVSNYGGWSNPEIDKLVDQAAHEQDNNKRLALEEAALKIAKDETMLVPLHQQPIAWAMLGKVKSVDFRADNKPRHWLTQVGK